MDFRQSIFIHVGIALARIGRRDDNRTSDQPGFIERFFVAYRIQFAVRGDLPFQPHAQTLDVFTEMRGNVPCDQFDAIERTINSFLFGVLALQVGALSITKIHGDLLEPAADRILIDIQCRLAFLVQQRCHGFVLHRALHGIGMHDRAKLVGGFFIFQQGRARESDIRSLG